MFTTNHLGCKMLNVSRVVCIL